MNNVMETFVMRLNRTLTVNEKEDFIRLQSLFTEELANYHCLRIDYSPYITENNLKYEFEPYSMDNKSGLTTPKGCNEYSHIIHEWIVESLTKDGNLSRVLISQFMIDDFILDLIRNKYQYKFNSLNIIQRSPEGIYRKSLLK